MSHVFHCGTVSAWARRIFQGRSMSMLVAAAVVSTAAYGHGVSHGDLVLDHPYALPSLTGISNGAAYLRGIDNRGDQSERLLSASSPIAARVELHRMTLDAGVMRMREVAAIELPPKTVTALRHGGPYHLMLMGLKQPLKDGDRFDLTLNFERSGSQSVKVWVQTPRDAASSEHRH
jgi:copper(I)-binding protein